MDEHATVDSMIEVSTTPRNREHYQRLMAFAREVLDACNEAGITPILDGSLAVFTYTQRPDLDVRDIDFSCSELDFPSIQRALESRGIQCEIRPWHVLQTRRDGLKIEFGAAEHWNRGIPDTHEPARIADTEFRVIGPNGLRAQYQRGLDATSPDGADPDPAKHQRIAAKLQILAQGIEPSQQPTPTTET